ncbi:hypothetical protein AGMMS50268_25050 [Spirochaetia bacterium]|nr:hypothetical protein AGMMS50268_25050 [Spirochaetia bacterium]
MGARKVLQSYSFSSSVTDPKGAFSLTFYPDEEGDYNDPLFDKIEMLDIVLIYERYKDGQIADAAFTGIVKNKKYVVQMSDTGARRVISVTGYSIGGLIADLKMTMDLHAMLLTGDIANDKTLNLKFTTEIITESKDPPAITDLVNKVYDAFIDISENYGKLTMPDVFKYIDNWMAPEKFFIDTEEKMFYPVGNLGVYKGTQSFFDLIEGVCAKPLYEIFPRMRKGKTEIVIRQAPFDKEKWLKIAHGWEEGKYELPIAIDPTLLKSFDIAQSDSEVYTVFFAYLRGYPLTMDQQITIEKIRGDSSVVMDVEKFGKYGFRPLYLTINGFNYKQDDKDVADLQSERKTLSERLRDWFGNLEKMYNGTITLSTSINRIMPETGEKISFLGGEFYITGAEHRWNYEGNPETILTVTRGAEYNQEGQYVGELKEVTKKYEEMKGGGSVYESWIT